MSEPMQCEVCENIGRRRMRTLCPEGWVYADITRNGSEFVVPVCSERCRTEGWQPILFPPCACDACGKPATAQHGGWSYLPASPSTEEGLDKDVLFSPIACSPACREAVWNQGPGVLDLGVTPWPL